ncbi:metallophosphoesterase family protein [Oribacterium sp. P6A1]|uniref:metallophosphoesterase family protein n=1 Tax=Oribacterium sp. P6A1 TaxID=1410612 RepID=UPI000689F7F3|nr:metallophosphoesterase [Oribacterium sp. P6A1]
MEMKKKGIILIPLFMAILMIIFIWKNMPASGISEDSSEAATPPKELIICVASDIHYIAPELTDGGAYFTELIENADGKAMQYCEEITDAFVDRMNELKPDVLIISGDLTFNGAKASHEGLAAKLKKIEDTGVRVLVIPGNHDLYSRTAACFEGDGYTLVDNVSAEAFAQIYGDFGYREAKERDSASLSYTYDVSPELRLILVDVNTDSAPGKCTDETLAWVSEQLKDAKAKNMQVIAVSHQNLTAHNPMFTDGFVMGQNERLLKLYQEYGVRYNLSGHMHIQHVAEEEGIKDIATSSLMVSPCQFGVIELKKDSESYHTEELAFEHSQEVEGFFKDTSTRMLKRSIKEPGESACEFFSKVNAAYFSGRRDTIEWDDEAYREITEKSAFVGLYLKSVYDDGFSNDTEFML